ncbi:hypothetical protein HaLaN_23569 [Haematococcus lacustris]|uniref:Uncharacterized protein n=1 Tax=Haematococcus lacustris TaxID=44745 RepID=A0A699ZSE4_HAELA|nr:hypothetical protein HaLaN_23569 [Haematococcus lacustris]
MSTSSHVNLSGAILHVPPGSPVPDRLPEGCRCGLKTTAHARQAGRPIPKSQVTLAHTLESWLERGGPGCVYCRPCSSRIRERATSSCTAHHQPASAVSPNPCTSPSSLLHPHQAAAAPHTAPGPGCCSSCPPPHCAPAAVCPGPVAGRGRAAPGPAAPACAQQACLHTGPAQPHSSGLPSSLLSARKASPSLSCATSVLGTRLNSSIWCMRQCTRKAISRPHRMRDSSTTRASTPSRQGLTQPSRGATSMQYCTARQAMQQRKAPDMN